MTTITLTITVLDSDHARERLLAATGADDDVSLPDLLANELRSGLNYENIDATVTVASATTDTTPVTPDVHVLDCGTTVLFTLLTPHIKAWVAMFTDIPSYAWMGRDRFVLDARPAQPFIETLDAEGFLLS
jgi:hypothetical protein